MTSVASLASSAVESIDAPEGTETRRRSDTVERKRILVVDDDRDIRGLLDSVLTDHGYAVTVASHGVEALRLLHAEYVLGNGRVPHLILLDVMMPVMDGLEFYTRLRTHHALRQIPVVVITAQPNEYRIPWVVSLAKPMSVPELIATVQRHASP